MSLCLDFPVEIVFARTEYSVGNWRLRATGGFQYVSNHIAKTPAADLDERLQPGIDMFIYPPFITAGII